MRNSLLIILFLTAFISCEKDKDDVPPTVIFKEPRQGNSYNVLESVSIKATVSDNEKIESIVVTLTNSNRSRYYFGSKSFSPGSKTFDLQTNLVLADSLLESGDYFIEVKVDDGENEISAFQKISIAGIPRRRLSILAACESATGSRVYEYKNNQLVNLLDYPYSIKQLECNSFDQHLWVLPKNAQKIEARSLRDNSLLFTQSLNSTFTDPYQDIELFERSVYWTQLNGDIIRLSSALSKSTYYRSSTNEQVGPVAVGGQYVTFEESPASVTRPKLHVNFKNGGGNYNTAFINSKVYDLLSIDVNKVLILHQNSIDELNIPTNSITTKVNIALNSPLKMIQGADFNVFVLGQTELYSFNTNTNALNRLMSGLNARDVQYDELTNTVLLSDGNRVLEYSLPSMTLQQTYVFPTQVLSFRLRYNR